MYDEVVQLVHKSFATRSLADQEHPEWGVKNWDAGFYQIYKLIDEYKLDDLICFRESFKNLELKIEQFVYRLDMLNP